MRLVTCLQLPIALLADASDVWKVKLLKLALYFACLLLLKEALQGRLFCKLSQQVRIVLAQKVAKDGEAPLGIVIAHSSGKLGICVCFVIFGATLLRELMEDPEANILVPISSCCVGNLCANRKPHGFVFCSCRLQTHDNLAQQLFRDRRACTQPSLCSNFFRIGSWQGLTLFASPQLGQSPGQLIRDRNKGVTVQRANPMLPRAGTDNKNTYSDIPAGLGTSPGRALSFKFQLSTPNSN